MFKLIGGAVVCGFALYGLAKYLSLAKMKPTLGKSEAGTSEADAVHASDPTPVGGAA